MPSPFYIASVVLFQLLVSHVLVIATPLLNVHVLNTGSLPLKALALAACF